VRKHKFAAVGPAGRRRRPIAARYVIMNTIFVQYDVIFSGWKLESVLFLSDQRTKTLAGYDKKRNIRRVKITVVD